MPTNTKTAEATIEAVAPAPGLVRCRVTKYGHDKIFTGEARRNDAGKFDIEDGANIFPRYPVNSIIDLPIRVAQAQEDAGNLEIQED